jgi:hypothetical protein
MRATLLASALVIAGCASQPTTTATTPATATPATAPAPAAAAGQPEQTATDPDLEKTRLAEALKHGYRVVNKDGETLYCRSDWATGSHIQKNTVCLTAQQLDDMHQRNQQALEGPNTPINMPRSPMSGLH